MNLIESGAKSIAVRLTDPAYTPTKGAVTFTLSLVEPGGPELVHIPGWRVWKGLVTPPSTRKKNGMYINTVILDPKFLRTVDYMVQEWAKDFPLVRFPSIEEPNGE